MCNIKHVISQMNFILHIFPNSTDDHYKPLKECFLLVIQIIQKNKNISFDFLKLY